MHGQQRWWQAAAELAAGPRNKFTADNGLPALIQHLPRLRLLHPAMLSYNTEKAAYQVMIELVGSSQIKLQCSRILFQAGKLLLQLVWTGLHWTLFGSC